MTRNNLHSSFLVPHEICLHHNSSLYHKVSVGIVSHDCGVIPTFSVFLNHFYSILLLI